jgi:uncharacterized OsmC-like protein
MSGERAARKSNVVVNGVDVDQIIGTIDAVKAAPALAKFTFRVSNRWIRGGQNRTTIRSFWGAGAEIDREPFVLDSDEPHLMFGEDQAPNPIEYLMHALAGCVTTSFVYQAAMRGVSIEAMESQIEGDIDMQGMFGASDGVRNGFENLHVNLRVRADCSTEVLKELCETTQRRSPVLDIVSRPVSVSVSCEPLHDNGTQATSTLTSLSIKGDTP